MINFKKWFNFINNECNLDTEEIDELNTIERDLNVLNIIHTKCVSMSNNLYKIWKFNDYNEYHNYFNDRGLIFDEELTESEFLLLKEWINHAI